MKKLEKILDKAVLPIAIITLLYFLFGSIYNLNISVDDLIENDGIVRLIQIEEESAGRGRINENFYVYLTDGKRFKIMDDELFVKYRSLINRTVRPGDSITIYNRTSTQTLMSLGTSNLIYQLEHKDNVLFPISVMHQNFRGLLYFELIILAGLIIVLIVRIRKKATDNRL